MSAINTINLATNWIDAAYYGGQLMVNSSSPVCNSPRPASSWPTYTNMSGGADGKAWLGIHSISTVQGEGATNVLLSPMEAGVTYVGYFYATALNNAPYYAGNGYLTLIGMSSNSQASYYTPSGGFSSVTGTNLTPGQHEFLASTPTITSNQVWTPRSFTMTPSQNWSHIRVEARRSGSNNTYIYFDNFVMLKCKAVTPPVVEKTSWLVSDPVNAATNPKSIPGARLRYCLFISNEDVDFTMQAVSMTDNLPSTLSYVPGSIRSGTSCASASTVEDDDNLGSDEVDPAGAYYAGGTIYGTRPSLNSLAGSAIVFDVTVN